MQKNTMQCVSCKQVLLLSKFRRYKSRPGSISHRHNCKSCECEKSRERYQQKTQSKIDNDEKPDPFRFMDFYRKVKGR